MGRLPRPKNFTPAGQKIKPRQVDVVPKPPRTALKATAKSLVAKYDKLDAPTRREKLRELEKSDPELCALVRALGQDLATARAAAAAAAANGGAYTVGLTGKDAETDREKAVQAGFQSRSPAAPQSSSIPRSNP